MALSHEQKRELAEFYKRKDLYDPAKAPEQQVPDFYNPDMLKGTPMEMNQGGECGYADGGYITTEQQRQMAGSNLQAKHDAEGQAAADAENAANQPKMQDALANVIRKAPKQPTIAPEAALPAIPASAPMQPQQAAAVNPAPNQGDDYASLIQSLKKGPGMGQYAMQGLAGLADAISSGVARAGNPGFQKNIIEQQGGQKQRLMDALRAKYEEGFRGKQLASEENRAKNTLEAENERARLGQAGESARSAAGIEAAKERTAAELGVRQEESALSRQQSGAEAAAKLPATGLFHPTTWGKGKMIEGVREQLLNQSGPQSQEVVRIVDGKPAIFNAQTKQFVRWAK